MENKDQFKSWSANVIDEFKNKSLEEIRCILQDRAFPFAVAMEHMSGDFNLGTVFRNANAFGAKEVFYIGGSRSWDRRSAVGVQNYLQFTHLKTIDDVLVLKDKYTFIGLDNVPGSVPMETFEWPKNTLMILGEEGPGLTKEITDHCKAIVSITQYGSVRSLNAGCASAIAMYDFIRKFKK